MKKYKTEDYFSVIEIKTGKKICDCGAEEDALTMVAFDPQNRTVTRNQFLAGQVVDIEIPKALPTTNIVPSVPKEYFDSMYPEIPDDIVEPLVLPESQLQPLNL